MRAPSRAFAALVGACLLAAYGAENSHPTSAATRAWTMRVGLENDVQLDPSLADIYDPVAYLTCLKLLRYTSTRRLADSRLVPEAAVAMPHISRDHKTYVFTLRRGLRYSDGSPVTAANYAAAIRRILNPSMRSPGVQGIADIIASVRARRLRLTVPLKRPAGDFLARVGALSFACPIPTDLPVNPAGVDLRLRAGPYFIRAHRANRELVLRRNPYYRGGARGGPQTIDFRIGASETQLLAAVERGRLDYAMTGIPDDVARRLARRYGVDKRRFYVVPQLQTTFLGMNNARPLLQNNVALRRAINLALDRRAIVRQAGFTRGWTLTDQLLPPGMRGFRPAAL
jgi:peptide/nickel transport system substrate-binding protein